MTIREKRPLRTANFVRGQQDVTRDVSGTSRCQTAQITRASLLATAIVALKMERLGASTVVVILLALAVLALVEYWLGAL